LAYENVLITGIRTGFGHALAKRCLDDGSRVFGISRNPPEDLIGHAGLRFVALDLRCFDEIPGQLAGLLEGLGSLDLVLLNAGVLGEIKDLKDTSMEEMRRVMDLNVWANKMLIDALLAGECRIKQVVAISSGAAFNGSGGWGAYSISKSALNLLIRVYAHEHPDTHFTALAPGIIHTDMLQEVLDGPSDPRYPAQARIRQAKAESRVMTQTEAAEKVMNGIPKLLREPSGSFLDIRQM
jgi:NAD(P)-dependent dehydrogenase (short-subunit alcohol dehydrogenase family)